MVHIAILLGLLWLPFGLTQETEVSQESSFVKVNEVIKNFLSQINDLMDTDNKEKAEEIINRLNAANLTLTPQQRQSLNQRTRGKLWVPPFHRSYIQRRNVSSITASINGVHGVAQNGPAQLRVQARQPQRREEIPEVFEKITEISKPNHTDATVQQSPLTVHRPPVVNQQRRLGISTPLQSPRRPANFKVQKGKTQKIQVRKQARQPLRRTQFRNTKNFKPTEKVHKPLNPIPQTQNRQIRPDEPLPRPAVNQQKMQLGVRDHLVVLMPTTDEPENVEPKWPEPITEMRPNAREIVPRRPEDRPSPNPEKPVDASEVHDSPRTDESQNVSLPHRTPVQESVHEHPLAEEPRPKFDKVVPYNPQDIHEVRPQTQPHRATQRRIFRQRPSQEVQEPNQQRRQEQSLEQSLNMELFEVFKKYNITGFVLKSGEFSVKALADPSRTQFIPTSLNPNEINVENSKRRRKLHEFEDDELNVILTGALRNQTQSASRASGPQQAPPTGRQATPIRKGLERPRHFPIGKKEQIKDPFARVQRDQKQNFRRKQWRNGDWKQRQARGGRHLTLAESFQKREQFQELW